MMKVDRVLETCLYVDDLEAAEVLYSEVLGLEKFSSVKGRHVFFRLGQAMLLLFHPDATSREGQSLPPHGARGPGHVAFAVEESKLPGWREWLTRRGIAIEKEARWPGGEHSLYFRDPAGNSLELTSPRIWGL